MAENSLYEEQFRQALRIRMVQEHVIKVYPTDCIQSPVHLSIGQEAVAVGVCQGLKKEDWVFGSCRSHAWYLAKGGDLPGMMAELYGKVTGVSKGKAGSMHLTDPRVGFMGSSAIVGSWLPHAAGAGFAAKRRKTGQVIVLVLGDGATDQGVFHETLNFIALHQLPVLVVCENNNLAVHTSVAERQAYKISELPKAYGIRVSQVAEGYDFMKVNEVAEAAIGRIRANSGPEFIEAITFREREHVGPGLDYDAGYRSEAEKQAWFSQDPLTQDEATRARVIPALQQELAEAVRFAESSPWPGPEELLTDVV